MANRVQMSSGATSFDFGDDFDGGPSPLDAASFLTLEAISEKAKTVPEGGIAAARLPGVSFFSSLAEASKDMSTDWLQDTTEPEAQPILSSAILAKLKARQIEHANRAAAEAKSTTEATSAAPSSSTPHKTVGNGKRTRENDTINPKSGSKGAHRPEIPLLPSERKGEAGLVESGFGDDDYLNFGDLKNQEASNLVLTAAVEAIEGSATKNKGKAKKGGKGADLSAISVPLWAAHRVRNEGGYCVENAAVALHQEVMDIVDFLRPTRSEVNMRRLIELEITDICNRLWPHDDIEVVVYGSMSTHLMLPLSDLDMTILNVPVSTADALTRISGEIGKLGLCSETFPQLILKTKVPLVKFEHRMSGVKVDISINAGDGQVNSAIVKRLIGRFPEAKYLIMVIKYFLKQRDFDEPFKGGMGSFSTTLLVISFLQHHPIYNEDRDRRHLFGLGRLLVDFFRYYGNCFNYNKAAVVVGEGGCYYDRSRQLTDRNTGRPVQVIIEDPGNSDNNAASSLRNFSSIAMSFEFAYLALTAVFDVCDNMSPDAPIIQARPTLLSRILHVDADMVRGRNVCAEGYARWRSSTTVEQRRRVKQFRHEEDVAMWDPMEILRHEDSDAE